MKLRKKEKSLRKNFSFPPWIIKDFHGGIVQHPREFDFPHRDVDELILYK